MTMTPTTRGPSVYRRALAGVVLVLMTASCGSGSSGAPTPTATPMRWSASAPPCPNSEGGECLGRLHGGLYQTITFQPQITYRVPSGWANYEDTPGNFLLVPPGYDLKGVNAGTSDFIGIYTSILAAKQPCDGGIEPGVGPSPNAIARWMEKQPGLAVSGLRHVPVDGLHGIVLDVRMKRSWRKVCPVGVPGPTVPLITGSPPSGLDHGTEPGLAVRFYLLNWSRGTLAIEVDDVRDAGHLDRYSRIVQTLHFHG